MRHLRWMSVSSEDEALAERARFAREWGYVGLHFESEAFTVSPSTAPDELRLKLSRGSELGIPILVDAHVSEVDPGWWKSRRRMHFRATLHLWLSSFSNLRAAAEILRDDATAFASFILKPGHDAARALQAWPTQLRERLTLVAPFEFESRTKPAYGSRALAGELSRLRAQFPWARMGPPPGWGWRDSRFPADEDRYPRASVVFDSRRCEVPEISIVVPAFNNRDELLRSLHHLRAQTLSQSRFEILIVDDGSSDGTAAAVSTVASVEGHSLAVIRMERASGRTMGDSRFRAGLARNYAAAKARGSILCFLDADILVAPEYLESVREALRPTGVVAMGRRMNLSKEASARGQAHGAYDIHRDAVVTDLGYWDKFHTRAANWNSLLRPWRYVCTHSLSLRKSDFEATGGFRENFIFYGFEDSELGLRLWQKGSRFQLLNGHVWHLHPEERRSEFAGSHLRKRLLLARSAPIFTHHTLHGEVFDQCRYLERRFLPFRLRVDDVFGSIRRKMKALGSPPSAY